MDSLCDIVIEKIIDYGDTIDTLLNMRLISRRYNNMIYKDRIISKVDMKETFGYSISDDNIGDVLNKFKYFRERISINSVYYRKTINYAASQGCLELISMVSEEISTHYYRQSRMRNMILDACRTGEISVIDRMTEEPFNINDDFIRNECRDAYIIPFSTNNIELIKRFTRPPFNLNGAFITHGSNIMQQIFEKLNMDILKIIIADPFNITTDHFKQSNKPHLIDMICRYNRKNTLLILTHEPFNLTGDDLRFAKRNAVYYACKHNNVKILKMLVKPPFNMDRSDLKNNKNILSKMCECDSVEAMRALTHKPFNLNGDDIRMNLSNIIYNIGENGSIGMLKLFTLPPFNLNRDDIMPHMEYLLNTVNSCDNIELFKILISPPFSLNRDDIINISLNNNFFSDIMINIDYEILKILVKEPFNLTFDDLGKNKQHTIEKLKHYRQLDRVMEIMKIKK